MALVKAQLKQKGSIAIEAIYVLPLMLLATMFVLEAVNYGLDSLEWNQDMNSLFDEVWNDASQGDQAVFNSTTGMLQCSGGQVQPSATAASIMQQKLYDWMKTKSALKGTSTKLSLSDITVNAQQGTNAVGQAYYAVEASYPVQTVVLPELATFFTNLKIRGMSVYHFSFRCRAS
ncbi:MAG: hypothetical protein R3219_06900 [Hydrogenovibrio sp.]|nr:hypothetical protein [Hydrogenovibrio sp.]